MKNKITSEQFRFQPMPKEADLDPEDLVISCFNVRTNHVNYGRSVGFVVIKPGQKFVVEVSCTLPHIVLVESFRADVEVEQGAGI